MCSQFVSHTVPVKQQIDEAEPPTRRRDFCILEELLILLKWRRFKSPNEMGSGATVLRNSQR